MSYLMTLFAAISALISIPAFASPQETITDSKAQLTFFYCPEGVSDCGDSVRIVVKGKAYMPVGNTEAISKELDSLIRTNQFHKAKSTPAFPVTGYTQVRTNSGGWGPRTYTVFVITQATFTAVARPRSMPPRGI